jgi:hypothetical protein
MSSRRIRVGLALPMAAAIAAAASAALADTDSPAQARATIRGTGKDVSIVYSGASKAPARRAVVEPPVDIVLDATRLAEQGADDQSLIAFLRSHQAQLPPIVENEAVRRLRKAGAGPAVISDLSRMTALDIGETAEGPPVQYAYEPPPASDAPFPSADMGYPYYGSYGGYGSAIAPRHHHGRFGPPRHVTLPARARILSGPLRGPTGGRGKVSSVGSP